MNREIKFRRAFFTDAEKTKFSHFDTWGVGVDNASFKSPGSNNFAIYFEDQQYTGLKDKNGKEIYDGDICRIKFDVEKVEDYIYNSLTVKEKESGTRIFVVESPLFNDQPELNADEIEVIGNIFSNPELLQP